MLCGRAWECMLHRIGCKDAGVATAWCGERAQCVVDQDVLVNRATLGLHASNLTMTVYAVAEFHLVGASI